MNAASRVSRSINATAVAEMQGLYGPFSFSEKLLQRIWRTRDFDGSAAVLLDGRRLTVEHPGRWNLLGGPDFRDARLVIGGESIRGDVELHLHASDWKAHGHAADAAYDRVVLHVVLFPPESGERCSDSRGAAIPCIALLPILRRGLEEFAAEEAIERLAGRGQAYPIDGIAEFSKGALELLLSHARSRFRQKVGFASRRIMKLGWEGACHHAALEILGYRFNRVPMFRIADRWPLAAWREREPSIDVMIDSEREGWARQGSRPANLPRVRLGQYSAWVRMVPDWPERLRDVGRACDLRKESYHGRNTPRVPLPDSASVCRSEIPSAGSGLAVRISSECRDRKKHWLVSLQRITGGAVGGTRFDTLVCDGFLPLLAADGTEDLESTWLCWKPGDQPPTVVRTLRELDFGGSGRTPLTHGLCQGFLGWLIDREHRENR